MGMLAWLFGKKNDPALIYAHEKTGWHITEENRFLLSDEDLAEWDAAIEEYQRKHRKPSKYLIGTVAFYGLDDTVPTKITARVITDDDTELAARHWIGTNVTDSPKVKDELREFFHQHGVMTILVGSGNIGCPHEEGLDFPHGEDCPFCLFWNGKQGSNRKE